MPFGDFVNAIPPIGFLVVHFVLFVAGAYFAWSSFGAAQSTLGWGFPVAMRKSPPMATRKSPPLA